MNTATDTTRQTAARQRPPGTEQALLWLEALLAVGAFAGAAGLITGGVDLGEATADLPFASPVLAGLALGLVNGILPAAVLGGALARRPWARPGHLAVGLALTAWIVAQVAFIGLGSWLQVAYFAYGVVITILAWRLLRTPAP